MLRHALALLLARDVPIFNLLRAKRLLAPSEAQQQDPFRIPKPLTIKTLTIKPLQAHPSVPARHQMRHMALLSGFLLVLGLVLAPPAKAQKAAFRTGQKLFEDFAFAEAIPHFKEAVDGPNALEASLQLAECYRLTNQLERAEPHYAKAVEQPNIRPEFILHYARALQANGKCAEAVEWCRRYSYLVPKDPRGDNLMASCADISELIGSGAEYELLPTTINSTGADMAPVFWRNGIVFASARSTDERDEGKDGWTGQPYLGLFFAEGQKERFNRSQPFAPELASDFNDGPASFNGTGNTIYFSRNARKAKGTRHGGRPLQLYTANLVDGAWTQERRLDFCDPAWEHTHPSVSPDGSMLYFASDRPGGLGGMDIWRVRFGENGWSEPENLGSSVNTPGNEVFPFIHDDGTLYFASDGRFGLGGLDLYAASVRGGKFRSVENLRSPINSPQDDFGLVFDATKDQGYFSSNRRGSQGDDIYSLSRFPLFVEGLLVADGSMNPLPGARVVLTQEGDQVQQVRSDAEGRFVLRVSPFAQYQVTAYREGFNAVEVPLETNMENPDKLVLVLEELIDATHAIALELKVIDKTSKRPIAEAQLYLRNESDGVTRSLETDSRGIAQVMLDKRHTYTVSADKMRYFNLQESIPVEAMTGRRELLRVLELEGYEIGKSIRFKDIAYENAQTELSLEAKVELDALARLMLVNPTMTVEIGSHTDANGRNVTNDRVSRGRAEAVVDYLVGAGVERDRLTAVGYGESRLVNHCADGVSCPKELHRENRRTEWTILSF
jgi:outer membrane protein OmpA-like peptidoglycan-associated protein/tetratricopeptide (TPR) repeat protein